MSNHAMVDIETMSTEPNAAIVSIGACLFDMYNQDQKITDVFNVRISLESNQSLNRDISASTVMWWMRQSKEAQASLTKEPISNLKHALTQLRMWLDNASPKVTRVWAKDPDFDVVILSNAYKSIGDRWPLQYFMSRSVRTIIEVAYPEDDMPDLRVGTHHDAADDAITQALQVRHCWHKLHGTLK